MRILVLGGTYFLGKAFVNMACKEHEITVLNRGTKKVTFSHSEHVKAIIADRHSLVKNSLVKSSMLKGQLDNISGSLTEIKDTHDSDIMYDVVVDFCAYDKGDIRQLVEALGGRIKKYIFISTSDVYARGLGQPIDENGTFETRDFGGAAGAYILGKAALESELKECGEIYGFNFTSVRPVFIYGPDNYAPREGIFFNWIERAGQIIYPKDSDGSFQMVYVEDVARMILKLCREVDKHNQLHALNVFGPESVTYERFCDALKYAVGKDFQKIEVPVADIQARQIALPFPLTKEESETYVSTVLVNEEYTSLKEGLKRTYEKFKEDELFQKIDELFDANKPKEAEAFMLEELDKSEKSGNDEVTLKLLNELIGYYRQTSEKEQLVSVIDKSLSLIEAMGLKETISYATTTLNAANAYRSIGRIEDARKYYNITESIYNKQIEEGRLSENDMLIAGFYNNISLMYQEMEDYCTSRDYLIKALHIVEKNDAGFEIAVTYANLANTEVAAGYYNEAMQYANKAIMLFKARGLRDPHYCAALSALGTCYYENGNIRRARDIFGEAMHIVETTFGQNSQYFRLKENCELCDGRLGNTVRNGMELSKRYYETYGISMIHEKFPEYESKIAVGLAGEGSDCFGFDDEYSADHDYGPDFCMWLSDETYDAIGEELQEAYNELPSEFEGYMRTVTPMGQGRRGVLRISDYYKKFVGTDIYENIDFTAVEDYSFAACVNGEVFKDDEGVFSSMRNRLLGGFPENIRLLKIAQEMVGFSQCGQYNYGRMINRDDSFTAAIMLSDCMKHAMKLYHYILNVYPPHDKWLYKSTSYISRRAGEDCEQIMLLLDQVMSKSQAGEKPEKIEAVIEQLGQYFADKMCSCGIIDNNDPYLDHHIGQIIAKSSEIIKKE